MRSSIVTGSLLSLCWMVPLAAGQSGVNPPAWKICVARVANHSTVSADSDRLTERLTRNLKQSKLEAVAMESSTTMNRDLTPTRANSDEAEDKQCDYTLLTQIVDLRQHPGMPNSTQPGAGARVPSIDAADPMGGSSGPVYRENLQLSSRCFSAAISSP